MATNELGRFLAARRAAVSPDQAGVRWSGVRRVPGLRREEVALLSGVSVDYYARLEQGREENPSASVLDALCRALELTGDAREHLFRLAGAAPTATRTTDDRVDPALRQLMDAWPQTPAFVLNRRLDILALNALAGALFSPFAGVDNLARMVFLDEEAPHFFVNWDRAAEACVANLRLALGFDAHDSRTLALIAGLRADSARFDDLWQRNDARGKTHDSKAFRHTDVGNLSLEYSSFDVRSAPGQQLVVYRAEPGSPSDDALTLLSALSATDRAADRAPHDHAGGGGVPRSSRSS